MQKNSGMNTPFYLHKPGRDKAREQKCLPVITNDIKSSLIYSKVYSLGLQGSQEEFNLYKSS